MAIVDGNLEKLTQWKCKNGHVLGVVERAQVSNGGTKYHVSRLMLFRQAIDLEAVGSLENVDVLANIEGTVMDIRCSCCSTVRTWWMGDAALERFMQGRKVKV